MPPKVDQDGLRLKLALWCQLRQPSRKYCDTPIDSFNQNDDFRQDVWGNCTIMRRGAIVLGAVILATAGAAAPPETITYTYDGLGRLVTIVHTGTVNSGVQAAYTYDKLDNRSNVTVTGSSNPAPSAMDAPAALDDSSVSVATDEPTQDAPAQDGESEAPPPANDAGAEEGQ